MNVHDITGWLRRSQLRIITAVQATIALLVVFEVVGWSETQVAAVIAVFTAWLAVATAQNVDVRALREYGEATLDR